MALGAIKVALKRKAELKLEQLHWSICIIQKLKKKTFGPEIKLKMWFYFDILSTRLETGSQCHKNVLKG